MTVDRERSPASSPFGETCSGARNLPRFLCSLLTPGEVLVVGASEVAVEAAECHDVTVVEWNTGRLDDLHEFARRRGKQIRVIMRDPCRQDLGLPPRSFPNAVCLDVLERLPDDVAVLERIHRVLEPGGRLIVRVPARPWSRDGWPADGGARRYDPESLRAALDEASFRTLRLRHWNLVGVPSVLLEGRRSTRRSSEGEGVARRKWWDSPLDLWYRTVEKRVGFPVGVSLVAVATPHLEKARLRRPEFAKLGGRNRTAYEPMAAGR